MKYNLLLIIFFSNSLVALPSFSDGCFTLGQTFNTFVGFCVHVYRNMVYSGANERLSEQNEKFVLGVAKDLNFKGELNIYKIPNDLMTMGPHVAGNYIYLNEYEFLLFKKDPSVLRFVIAHEIKHIEKFHMIKQMGAGFISSWLFVRGFLALLNNEKIMQKFKKVTNNTVDPLLTKKSIQWYPPIVSFLTSYYVSRYASRLCEKEADCEAIEGMGKLYGYTNILQGAKAYLGRYKEEKPSLLSYVHRTHPLNSDRFAFMEERKEKLLERDATAKAAHR